MVDSRLARDSRLTWAGLARVTPQLRNAGLNFFLLERISLILAGGIQDTGKGTAGCGMKSINHRLLT